MLAAFRLEPSSHSVFAVRICSTVADSLSSTQDDNKATVINTNNKLIFLITPCFLIKHLIIQ